MDDCFPCSKCKDEKPKCEFRLRKDAYGNVTRNRKCKQCILQTSRDHYHVNSDKYAEKRSKNRDKINSQKRSRYSDNKELEQERNRKYRDQLSAEQKEKIKLRDSIRYQKNKTKIVERAIAYQKNRRKNDISFKLKDNFSKSIRNHLKKKSISKKNAGVFTFLNYSLIELKKHLESQFESWMSWENWGKYNCKTWDDNDQSTWTWEIDHIIPQSQFSFASKDDPNFKNCWALSNLRPLSAKQNLLDGVSRIRHQRFK